MRIKKLDFNGKITPLNYSEILSKNQLKLPQYEDENLLKNVLAFSASMYLNFSHNLPKDKTLKLFFDKDENEHLGFKSTKKYVLHFLNELEDFPQKEFDKLSAKKLDLENLRYNDEYLKFLSEHVLDDIIHLREWELGHYYLIQISESLFKDVKKDEIEKLHKKFNILKNVSNNNIDILSKFLKKHQKNTHPNDINLEEDFYLLVCYYYLFKKQFALSSAIRFEKLIATKGKRLKKILKKNPISMINLISNEINRGRNKGKRR